MSKDTANRSSYEWIQAWNCETCFFADPKAIAQYRALHEKQDWLAMSRLHGWCSYPWRIERDGDTCKMHQAQGAPKLDR